MLRGNHCIKLFHAVYVNLHEKINITFVNKCEKSESLVVA